MASPSALCLIFFVVVQAFAYDADVPNVLINDASPLDESSAKFLKAELENGLVLNDPRVCESLGFFCDPLMNSATPDTEDPLPKRSLGRKFDSGSEPKSYEAKQPYSVFAWVKQSAEEPKSYEAKQPYSVFAWVKQSAEEPKSYEAKQPYSVFAWVKQTGGEPKPYEAKQPYSVFAWVKQGEREAKPYEAKQPYSVFAWMKEGEQEPKPYEAKQPYSVFAWVKQAAKVHVHESEKEEKKALAARAFRLPALQAGKSILLPYIMQVIPTKLVHPLLADLMPFNHESLPEVMKMFNIPPNSPLASAMARALYLGSDADNRSEHKKSYGSVKEMVEFAGSHLCKKGSEENCHLKAITQPFENKVPVTVNIAEVKELAKDAISCHIVPFPYEVYVCHKIVESTILEVTVKHGDEIKVLPVMCHMNTIDFRPDHPAFKDLNMKPGDGEICHWLTYKSVVWYV